MKKYPVFFAAICLFVLTSNGVFAQNKNFFIIENEVFADNSQPEEQVTFDFIIPSPGKAPLRNGKFSAHFLSIWQGASAYTLETVGLMPADKFNVKPADDVFSFAGHIAQLIGSVRHLQSYISGSKDVPFETENLEDKSKEELLKILEEALKFAEKTAADFPDGQVEDKTDFHVKGVIMTKGDVFMLMRDHLTHHRAQMLVCLRLNGIKPPQHIGR